MNAAAAAVAGAGRRRAVSDSRAAAAHRPALELVAFATLASLAGLRYAALLGHPPELRVIGVVAAATATGAGLAATRAALARRALAVALAFAIVLAGAVVSLRLVGVDAKLLVPWRWSRLAHQLGRGVSSLDGLWPYRAEVAQARLAVLFLLPAVCVPAAALAFWPTARRSSVRLVAALALLLGVYVTGSINEPRVGWEVQGTVLLIVLCLCLWVWRPRSIDGGRAVAWMLAGAAIGLIGARAVEGSAPLLDYHDWEPFGPTYPPTPFNWNQVYGPLPWPNSSETMVDVSSSTSELWRVTTLDRFDGVRFSRSPAPPPATSGLEGVTIKPQWVVSASFEVRGLSSKQLLSPGAIIAARIEGVAVPALGSVAGDGTLSVSGPAPQSGDRYAVTAYVPRPSVAEMRAAPPNVPAAYLPYTEFELPPSRAGAWQVRISTASAGAAARIARSPYARVYALARRLASGAPDEYDVIARIDAFLHRGFTYDQDPPRGAYPLVAFLLANHLGYCQQFSGAMTLLLRMDGIAARVAAGFLPGSRDPSTGSYVVSARNAHAWVEAYFAGIGWVAFDPTPPEPAASSASGAPAGAEISAQRIKAREAAARSRPRRTETAHAASGAHAGDEVALALAIATALALLTGAGLRLHGARVERALANDPEAALDDLSRALARAGIELVSGTTLAELEHRLASSHGPAASRYVRLLRARRYAADADPSRPSVRDRTLMRRELRAGLSPLARMRIALAIASRGTAKTASGS